MPQTKVRIEGRLDPGGDACGIEAGVDVAVREERLRGGDAGQLLQVLDATLGLDFLPPATQPAPQVKTPSTSRLLMPASASAPLTK